jgi:hypothetical protein
MLELAVVEKYGCFDGFWRIQAEGFLNIVKTNASYPISV